MPWRRIILVLSTVAMFAGIWVCVVVPWICDDVTKYRYHSMSHQYSLALSRKSITFSSNIWIDFGFRPTPALAADYLTDGDVELEVNLTWIGHFQEWRGLGYAHSQNLRIFWLPTWLVLPFLLVPLPIVLIWPKRTHRRVTGHCPRCGYDLRATPARCPECGAVPAK